ncbi:MAG: hypothetical protein RIB79_00200 [Allomuricauda sp.]
MKLSIGLIFLLQSCNTYKSTTVSAMQIGKHYKIKVADGREIANKCLGISNDSVTFKAREFRLSFHKLDIENVEKKRTPAISYIIGTALFTGLVLSVSTNKKDPIIE